MGMKAVNQKLLLHLMVGLHEKASSDRAREKEFLEKGGQNSSLSSSTVQCQILNLPREICRLQI